MNIVDQIHQSLTDMTKTERAVAAYFLGHRSDFVFLTLEQLARNMQVSTTSVIRFCRRVGFSGFKPFQEAVQKDLRFLSDLPDKYQHALQLSAENQLLKETVERSLNCVRQTFSGVDNGALLQTVEQIAKAGRVFTFGMKESFALAHYAYTRLLTVRKDVFLLSPPGEGEVEAILNLTETDLCLAFLFHRYTRQARDLLPLIKKRGAKVVLITNPPYSTLQADVDLILPCEVDAGGIKNSFTAPVVLTDYLCGAAAGLLGDAALGHMRQAEELFQASAVLKD